MYKLNYAPTTLGVQSRREIISGGTRTKKVEYHCTRVYRRRACKPAPLHYIEVTSFTLRLLYPRRKNLCYLLQRRNKTVVNGMLL